MNRNHVLSAAVTVLLAGGATACTGSSGSSPSTPETTGATAEGTGQLALTLATGDARSAPSGEQVRQFAQRVSELSDGTIEVSPAYHVAGHDPDFERAVAGRIADGEFDLAVVATRAWDLVGVRSLTALNAPFLVTTDELAAEIVTSDLADELMSGLPDAGVVGLALFPEGLRHPFGFDRPLRRPADYADSVMRVPYSATTEAVFAELGATVTAADVDAITQRGAESSFRLAPAAGIGTGNVVLYPKVNALVADAEVRDRLTDEQWQLLNEAAADTVAWAVDTLPDDREAAATFCEEGGTIVNAPAQDLRHLVATTAPVIEQLREDPTTASIIDGIQALGTTGGTQPVEPCSPQAHAALTRLDGTYETTVLPRQMREIGITDEAMIQEESGEFTVTLDEGTWTAQQVYATGPSRGDTWYGEGRYTLEGGLFTFYWGHEPGAWSSADITVRPNGDLSFSDQDDGSGRQYVLGSRLMFDHWERVG